MVKPAVVFGSGTLAIAETDMKRLGTWEMGEGNIKKDTWTSGRARNMEYKN